MSTKKNFVKLTSHEKNFIDKVSAISGIDHSTVKEVFLSTLIASTLEFYSGVNEINLPYLFKAKVSLEQLKEGADIQALYNIETSPSLHEVLLKIKSNSITWLEDFLKKEITKSLSSILEIEEEEEQLPEPDPEGLGWRMGNRGPEYE